MKPTLKPDGAGAERRAYVRGYQTGRQHAGALTSAVKHAEEKLSKIMVGGCTCGTKTPELQHHAERCHFRLAGEALDALQPCALGGNVPSEEQQ